MLEILLVVVVDSGPGDAATYVTAINSQGKIIATSHLHGHGEVDLRIAANRNLSTLRVVRVEGERTTLDRYVGIEPKSNTIYTSEIERRNASPSD